MRLPDFLIIGAQKSGTTWLADQLSLHPGIYMVPDEIHFFDKAQNFSRGLGWYSRHFDHAGVGQIAGEKTPDYLWANGDGAEGHLSDVHLKLYQTLPSARLIVVLRNPVERALSALAHLVRTRRIAPPFNVDELLLGKKHHKIRGHGVISKGFYYRQLKAYARLFNRSQIHVLIFEDDIAGAPELGLRRACEFLGVTPVPPQTSKAVHQNASRRSLLRLLADFYLPPVRPVSKVIDRITPAWKPVPSGRILDELYQTFAAENEKLFKWLGRPMPRSWEKRQEGALAVDVTDARNRRGGESKMARATR